MQKEDLVWDSNPRVPAPWQGRVGLPRLKSTGRFDRTTHAAADFLQIQTNQTAKIWAYFIYKQLFQKLAKTMVATLSVLYGLAVIVWRATRGPPFVKDFKEGEINE